MNDKLLRKAMALHQAGQHEEADQAYRKLAVQFPRDPDLLHFRGILASHRGDQAESIRLLTQAITLKPAAPEFHQNLAISHERANDKKGASRAYNEQGNALQKRNQFVEASVAFETAVKLDPDNLWAASNFAATLNELGDPARARKLLEKIEKKIGTPVERSHVVNSLGTSHYLLGDYKQAQKYYRLAIELNGENAEAHRNLSVALLAGGDLGEGFEQYDWRCVNGVHHMEHRAALTAPVWQGEPPEQLGGALLVLGEQGLGDTIQFARYVPMLADRGHQILFETQPEIYELFSEAWAGDDRIRVIRRQASGKVFNNLPYAAFVSVMSLPNRFATTLQTVPAKIPYLSAAPKRIAQWDLTMPDDDQPNVGLVWQGSYKTLHDKLRSLSPEALEPLVARGGVRFFSLQKGEAGKYAFKSGEVTRLDDRLRDFADTAGAIARLDLLISIDSSVAHLAGAMNCPVWLATPKALDWRWLRDVDASPWYPRHRLFRQKKAGEWGDTIAEIGKALDRFAKSGKSLRGVA